ncbi:SDR family oxidoreductase [Mediterraneibacter sp. NSJ-55]|uniref:SDR family oxidoreductase n=1 Tax=Mediterraneibacter hominis TaxID=2763054 RepID=A0A923LKW8_9FIRM|nr:SDR family oxidoreductase [Mediterraneibacter hominis]
MLKGKNAVVTGARRGIGRATVEVFAKNGAAVWACARRYDEGFEKDMMELSRKYHADILPVYFDITDEGQIKEAVKTIKSQKKQVDILANIAGTADFSKSFTMNSVESMKRIFDINFWGMTVLTQYISRLMIRNNRGSIVNVSSIAAIEGTPAQYEYAASKAAVNGGMRQLAWEMQKYGIRVNTVAPGIIATDMGNQIEDELKETVLKHIIMQREGSPQEVANVIAFLASDLSSYMTGQIIRVDGGGVNGWRK